MCLCIREELPRETCYVSGIGLDGPDKGQRSASVSGMTGK